MLMGWCICAPVRKTMLHKDGLVHLCVCAPNQTKLRTDGLVHLCVGTHVFFVLLVIIVIIEIIVIREILVTLVTLVPLALSAAAP